MNPEQKKLCCKLQIIITGRPVALWSVWFFSQEIYSSVANAGKLINSQMQLKISLWAPKKSNLIAHFGDGKIQIHVAIFLVLICPSQSDVTVNSHRCISNALYTLSNITIKEKLKIKEKVFLVMMYIMFILIYVFPSQLKFWEVITKARMVLDQKNTILCTYAKYKYYITMTHTR